MVVTVGDFVPRSMSEIIDDEMPLRAASIRKLKAAASRRCLTARPVRRLTSPSKVDNMSSIVHERAIQARSMDKAQSEAKLRCDRYQVVNGSVKPRLVTMR